MLKKCSGTTRYVHKVSFPQLLNHLLCEVTACTVVANKTGPTRVADFRAVFTAERPYLFLGPETSYAVEQ